MIAWLLVPLLAAAQTADPMHEALQFLNANRDIVQVKDNVYALLPPQLVAEGEVQNIEWSSDGSMLAFTKRTNAPVFNETLGVENLPALQEQELCEWSFADPHVKDLFSFDSKTAGIDQIEWLHGSDVLLVTASATRPNTSTASYSLYRFRPLGDAQELISNSDRFFGVEASPSQDLAFVAGTDSKDVINLSLIEDNGTKLVQVEPLEKGQFCAYDDGGWPCIITVIRDPLTNKRSRIVSQRIDAQTGAYKLSPTASYNFTKQTEGALTIGWGDATVTGGSGKNISIVGQWLDGAGPSPFPAALISADTKSAVLSPASNAVAYSSQGCLFVRRLVKLDLALSKALLNELLKEQAMSKAKQVGLAMIMYSNDYDDNLPGSHGWANSLYPYLKDKDLTNGFNYTYSGDSNLSKIDNPATTVLGYVQTTLGRAVAYADGHVKWIANP